MKKILPCPHCLVTPSFKSASLTYGGCNSIRNPDCSFRNIVIQPDLDRAILQWNAIVESVPQVLTMEALYQ